MNGDTPHSRGGRLTDGDKALAINANSVSGNVVVLRRAGIQDSVTGTQDAS